MSFLNGKSELQRIPAPRHAVLHILFLYSIYENVHPNLMLFFHMSCNLAYELCFDSYALGEKHLLPLLGGEWVACGMWGEYIFATVII